MEQLLTQFLLRMIKNYYYLAAGILAIVFAVTHALNGQNTVLPLLQVPSITGETRSVFFYVWHIITAENFVFGMAFLYMAFQINQPKLMIAAFLIAALLIIRWIVIFGTTLFYTPGALKNILVDTIAIAIYVTLIILGTKARAKHAKV